MNHKFWCLLPTVYGWSCLCMCVRCARYAIVNETQFITTNNYSAIRYALLCKWAFVSDICRTDELQLPMLELCFWSENLLRGRLPQVITLQREKLFSNKMIQFIQITIGFDCIAFAQLIGADDINTVILILLNAIKVNTLTSAEYSSIYLQIYRT